MMKTPIKFALAAAALLGLGAAAYAAQNHADNDAHAILNTKLSLVQAIGAAEQHAGGRAIRAELENENGRIVYGVEVVGQNQVTDVKVDANNGQIVSAQADKADANESAEGAED